MGDLTEHFSKHEFACKCGCGASNISLAHVQKMERFRAFLVELWGEEHKIVINPDHSGVRCQPHNKDIGSKPTSQHTWQPGIEDGRPCACDIHVIRARDSHRVPAYLVYWAAIQFGEFGGAGKYETFTHLDSRPGRKARWKGSG